MKMFRNFGQLKYLFKKIPKTSVGLFPKLYPQPLTLKRIVFRYHEKNDGNQFNIIQINQDFSYEQYVNNLKSIQWVSYQIRRLNTLLKQTKDIRNENYKYLRDLINQILVLSKYITESRAYHQNININIQGVFECLPILLRLIFSEKSNKTHQNIFEEQKSTYQFIQFSYYFQLCNEWRVSFDKDILEFYLHSYMNLLFDRNLFKYLSVYEVLRQSQSTQLVSDIIQNSKLGVNRLIANFSDKIQRSYLLNPYQMAIYLKYLRNIFNNSLEQAEKAIILDVLSTYILKSKQQWGRLVVHCENITYSLYLLLEMEQKKGNIVELLYQSMRQRIYKSILINNQDRLLRYLMALSSHQDKITCLKIEIWLSFLQIERSLTSQSRQFNMIPFIYNILNGIDELNVSHWRYKYVCWLLDLLLNKLNSLQLIHKICSSLSNVYLNSNEQISSMTIFLQQITHRNFEQLQSIINIHYSISNWLIKIPKSSLKDQNSSDLCSLLTIADKHPTLQQIYTPYLNLLLQLSLGHFVWIDLTKLYYYGLKFKVQQSSEQAYWNMEYVRRYILNQYATMGLRRRQIAQDSYFYKIIGITTPQKFYKNHLKPNQ